MGLLDGKVALITGAGGGLGEAALHAADVHVRIDLTGLSGG